MGCCAGKLQFHKETKRQDKNEYLAAARAVDHEATGSKVAALRRRGRAEGGSFPFPQLAAARRRRSRAPFPSSPEHDYALAPE